MLQNLLKHFASFDPNWLCNTYSVYDTHQRTGTHSKLLQSQLGPFPQCPFPPWSQRGLSRGKDMAIWRPLMAFQIKIANINARETEKRSWRLSANKSEKSRQLRQDGGRSDKTEKRISWRLSERGKKKKRKTCQVSEKNEAAKAKRIQWWASKGRKVMGEQQQQEQEGKHSQRAIFRPKLLSLDLMMTHTETNTHTHAQTAKCSKYLGTSPAYFVEFFFKSFPH